jgi:hypothetical protein
MASFFDEIMEDLVEDSTSTPQEVGYISGEVPVERSVSAFAESPVAVENAIDQQMSEAERRLSKALLYKQWVGAHLFDGDSTELTREVEAEISGFVRERLGVLLGVSKSLEKMIPVESQFTPIEAKVLKLLASKVLANPKLKGFVEKSPLLSYREPEPLPVKPTLRPRQQPEAAKFPVAAQVNSRVQPQSTTGVVQPKVKESLVSNSKEILPQDEEIIQEKGKKYRVKWVSIDPMSFGDKVEELLVGLPAGQHIRLPNGPGGGLQVYKATENDYFKILRLDLTPQVAGTNRVPFPSDMSMATATQSGVSAALSMSGFDKKIGNH